ncbi:DNA-binding PucR family transcriptional regulator [Kribbella amoyensis]|uniref:DNA-binding PucR family transcriptional regulator n=1 Tax=Kribbella amoyensis TaxID=996641 RepID=A0A561BWE4_9ACTN|nr:helix-turn-helix domain-containing protein [Kribbella amoyensis]TWD83072.1 DNA-binding PucR family transcriptional regulator [Kribbella amoyensis]
MITAPDLVVAVGPALFEVVVTGRGDGEVRDVFLADPQEPATGQPGDLVLGLGLRNAEEAVELLERCAATNASSVVLRTGLAQDPEVVATAERWLLTLIALQPSVTWAHVVWLLRGVLDRAAAPNSPAAGDAGVHQELFALADAAAAIVDAPVTIEDNQSRVLAYSSQHNISDTDPARVSTIVGRRVPPEVISHYRARGVFRRLARSSEPFFVPPGPNVRPRLVVPVRAGGEWLGSIWAMVGGPVTDEVTAELSNAASVLALHLLRLRAQADVARRSAIDRLRTVLRQFSPDAPMDVRLPQPPWRVVALATPDGYDEPQQLDLWESNGRRHGWSEPLLADLDGTVLAVVSDDTDGPGSWRWLRKLAIDLAKDSPGTAAAAGGLARYPADLPSSRAEAVELLGLVRRGVAEGPALRVEQAWHLLTVHRAVTSLDTTKLDGPLATLLRHDIAHDTGFVETLQAWLNYPGQPQQAAKELHLHTNTLRHRMKRIGEIADLDLSDPRERLALQLQIAAVRTEH